MRRRRKLISQALGFVWQVWSSVWQKTKTLSWLGHEHCFLLWLRHCLATKNSDQSVALLCQKCLYVKEHISPNTNCAFTLCNMIKRSFAQLVHQPQKNGHCSIVSLSKLCSYSAWWKLNVLRHGHTIIKTGISQCLLSKSAQNINIECSHWWGLTLELLRKKVQNRTLQ